jgi:hypothetical protein
MRHSKVGRCRCMYKRSVNTRYMPSTFAKPSINLGDQLFGYVLTRVVIRQFLTMTRLVCFPARLRSAYGMGLRHASSGSSRCSSGCGSVLAFGEGESWGGVRTPILGCCMFVGWRLAEAGGEECGWVVIGNGEFVVTGLTGIPRGCLELGCVKWTGDADD